MENPQDNNRYPKNSKMEGTPLSMRKHIAVFGAANAGKSTLFNRLLGQEAAIVSDIGGTTTDPVTKAMELIPYGPVALIDTAGLGDETELGSKRQERTMEILSRTDLVLYVRDINQKGDPNEEKPEYPVPAIDVFTKCDLAASDRIGAVKAAFKDAVFVGAGDDEGIDLLRKKMTDFLSRQERDDETLIGDLLPRGSSLILVCPIDSEAPKGRLILPQVQLIRDCLDHGMKAYVTTEYTLAEALRELPRTDLVVTDSQAFKTVNEIVPKEIKLTSFSMLLARGKGNFALLRRGAEAIDRLGENSKVLMLEGCTHNTSHEDIGRVKIPKLIEKYTGCRPKFEYFIGYDIPKTFEGYDLIIQCGMCMINKREVQTRLGMAEEQGIPVTNYGIALAKLNGILDRACEIFE